MAKEIKEIYANSQTLEIPNSLNDHYLVVDLDINVEAKANHIFTELGELFISACREKIKNSS